MKWVDQFAIKVQNGDSWFLIIIILIVSVLVMVVAVKPSIFNDWLYESIVRVPERYQKIPIVRKWFNITRGFHYLTKLKKGTKFKDTFKAPEKDEESRVDCLFSGWAFAHCLQHFLIVFLCPRLAYVSFIYGVTWELMESINSSHCTLDIFWNMCGCLIGLVARALVFRDVFPMNK